MELVNEEMSFLQNKKPAQMDIKRDEKKGFFYLRIAGCCGEELSTSLIDQGRFIK